MLLTNKNAVIYGAGGQVGSAVARVFAQAGAKVFLAGQTIQKLERVAAEIRSAGGYAEFEKVNALDREAVESHMRSILENHNKIDISFNLIGLEDEQGFPLVDSHADQFLLPVHRALKSQFLTATSAVRAMALNGGGVILMLSANAAKKPYENTVGFGVACAAIEALCRQLGVESGKHGVRVVCLRSAGSPDAAGVKEVFEKHAGLLGITREEFEKQFSQRTMLRHLPTLDQVAQVAVIMASGHAAPITGAVINVTCGELAD